MKELNKIINFDEFKEKEVLLDNIYLDPNNPRFFVNERIVPDARVIEDNVQKSCIEKIQQFDIDDLKENIKRIGFLPIDKVVVRPIVNSKDKYVVVEGNRRIAALKLLKSEHESGEILIDNDILKSILKFIVLIYSGKEIDISWILQGIRHISGVKDWPPYQQAKLLTKLIEDKHVRIEDAAKSIGIGKRKASRLLRSFYAYIQCLNDEEYGEFLDKDKFSFFQEAIFYKADTSMSNWLKWDDNERIFKEQANLQKFLSWITASEEEKTPRITRALDVRDVVEKALSQYPDVFKKFVKDNHQTADDLRHAIWQIEEAPKEVEEWIETLSGLFKQVEDLPDIKIRNSSRKKEMIALLTGIKNILSEHLKTLTK